MESRKWSEEKKRKKGKKVLPCLVFHHQSAALYKIRDKPLHNYCDLESQIFMELAGDLTFRAELRSQQLYNSEHAEPR